MKEKIKTQKNPINPLGEETFLKPPGTISLKQIRENTKILHDAEEKRRRLDEKVREFKERIEALFDEQISGEPSSTSKCNTSSKIEVYEI